MCPLYIGLLQKAGFWRSHELIREMLAGYNIFHKCADTEVIEDFQIIRRGQRSLKLL